MRRLCNYVGLALLLFVTPAWSELIVERLEDGGAAQKAELQIDDRLLSWERALGPSEIPASGSFDSAFDAREVELEQAPLGRVTLTVRRGESTLRLEVPPGTWRLTTRPPFAADALAEYRAAIEGLETEAAAVRLRELSSTAGARGETDLEVWLLYRGAKQLAASGDPELVASLLSEALARTDAESGSFSATLITEDWSRLLITRLGQFAEAIGMDEKAMAARTRSFPDSQMVPRLLTQLGIAAFRMGQLDVAEERFTEALETLRRTAPDDPELATFTMNVGALAQQRGDLETAAAYYRQALEIQERLIPDSLQTARTLHNLGQVLLDLGDTDTAESYFVRSLALKEQHSPDNLEVTLTLRSLSRVSSVRGDLATAEDYARRALEITERLAPDSPDIAGALSQLGIVAYQRGDLRVAEDCFRRSVDIRQRLIPGTVDLANSYAQLSGVAFERGDLVASENYSRSAFEIRESVAPESLGMAMALSQLGQLMEFRGDVASARGFYERGLDIRQRLAPNGEDVALSLTELGMVAAAQDDLVAAEEYHTRALDMRRKLGPDSLPVAESLYMLGSLAESRGDFAAAERYHRSALAIRERQAPLSLKVAASLDQLADLALERGELPDAAALGQRALAIVERVAPGSKGEATTAAALARIYRRMGKPEQSVALYRQAVDALEAQQLTFGGIESDRTVFRSKYVGIYRDMVGLLVQLGRPEEAFNLLEKSRARGMLELLAERDLTFTADLTEDLDRRRRLLAAEYDRVQSQLSASAIDTDIETTEELLAELHRLRREQGELREEIKKRAPRLEALQHPEPIELSGLGKTLDPGTIALCYSVTESQTLLFVTDSTAKLNVLTLDIGEAELREAVEGFREAVAQSRTASVDEQDLRRRGRRLYEVLLAPTAKALENADRLLIVPDGPLHLLPYGALLRGESKPTEPPSFMIEWKPLHVAVSLTVYDELIRDRTSDRGEVTLLAFGDPELRPGAEEAGAVSEELLRGLPASVGALQPMPRSREEVAEVTALFGEAGTALLGNDATEGRAKLIGTDPKLVHFATHGFIDERFPLDSGIVLSLPQHVAYGEDNGILQAWEILEGLRLDADLVTLSACNTALGAETAGEGIVGLTRAFHYAGARSVLASLWNVSDSSTAILMRRFYTYLKDGQTKDQALRAAQLDLIRGEAGPVTGTTSTERGVKRLAKSGPENADRYAAPYYWAAFTLSGDWR